MARSFRDLLEYVLGEIALCGSQGATLHEVLTFIEDFYKTPLPPHKAHQDSGRVQNVDHLFKARVWMWLTRHRELSVGKNREGNALTLDEMFARCTPGAVVNGPGESTSITSTPAATTPSQTPVKQESEELRIFVSEERTWVAIVGHLPDASRISPFEFALLSIIASRKEKGIIQPELATVSGQDKRSVPKRTDMLQTRGYIEKKPVQYKSMRTSLCILRKFSGHAIVAADHSEDAREVIDMEVFLEDIISCLRQYKLISRTDLRERLVSQGRYRLRILARALRRLEAIGCIRRVKAFSQYTRMMHRVLSIELLREPTESDRKKFLEHTRAITSLADKDDADDVEADEDQGEEVEAGDSRSKQVVKVPKRPVPQFVPGVTTLPNLLFKIINESGTRGMTNMEVVAAALGRFFRKPVEITLARLVETWQVSQPLHLRHMAIVRDSELRGTINCYVHYTFPNFGAVVQQGDAVWEAVEVRDRRGKKGPPPDAVPELDEYGFRLNYAPRGQLNGGNATIRDGLVVAGPKDYRRTRRDVAAVQLPDGSWTVKYEGMNWAKRSLKLMFDIDESLRETGTDPAKLKRRRDVDLWLGGSGDGSKLIPPPPKEPKPKKPKKVKKDFAGMTEKERLEAQGLDESYTEYSVLCLDRPTPGVYMTPFGKRQPVGKARGRPRKSRVAVFKFPWLKNFEWFTAPPEEPAEPEREPTAEAVSQSGPECEPVPESEPEHQYPAVYEESSEEEEYMRSAIAPSLFPTEPVDRKPAGPSKKRGRPRKERPESEKPPPKKKGRPRKYPKLTHDESGQEVVVTPASDAPAATIPTAQPADTEGAARVFAPTGPAEQLHTESEPSVVVQPEKPPPKKGGRPRKARPETENGQPKKRGRPPKRRKVDNEQPAEVPAQDQEEILQAELPAAFSSVDAPSAHGPSIAAGSEPLVGDAVDELSAPAVSDAMEVDEPEPTLQKVEPVREIDGEVEAPVPTSEPMDIDEHRTGVGTVEVPGQPLIQKPVDEASDEVGAHISAPSDAVEETRATVQTSETHGKLSPALVDNANVVDNERLTERAKSPPIPVVPDVATSEKSPDADRQGDIEYISSETPAATITPAPEISAAQTVEQTAEPSTVEHSMEPLDAVSINIRGPSTERRSETREISTPSKGARHTSKLTKAKKTEPAEKGRRFRKVNTRESGGSVALLRRRIVMDVLKASGGVHPMGTELWYPFTTLWFKSKYKEKPDMKTIRTTVSSLVETGKLRQHTFTGRNQKGLMVTKSLIADVELDPEDPRILNLQQKMLEADPHHYFPPGPEIDFSLRKAHRRAPTAPKVVPELDNVTVQLHKPPAFLMNREGTGLRQPRQLRAPGERRVRPDVRRLKALLRQHSNVPVSRTPGPSAPVSTWPHQGSVPFRATRATASSSDALLNQSQFFSGSTGTFGTLTVQPSGTHWWEESFDVHLRSQRIIPSGMNMLANQSQVPHPSTGTFGTVPSDPGAVPWWAESYDIYLDARLKPRPPPENLKDILTEARRPMYVLGAHSVWYDETTDRFFNEISMVQRWEKMYQNAVEPLPTNQFKFINHTIPGPFRAAPMEDAPQFAGDALPTRPPRGQARPPPPTRTQPPMLLPNYGFGSAPVQHVWQLPSKEGHGPVSWALREPIPITAHLEPTVRRITRLQERAEGKQPVPTATEEFTAVNRRQRAPGKLFPPAITQKLVVAVVVVRTLAGGQEGKHVDWPIVFSLFPDLPPEMVHSRAKGLISRHRLQMSKMQIDFQELFVEAYEKDQVPRIDYKNLKGYDWATVVDWAEDQLQAPKPEQIPDLPATRAQFDSLFDIRTESTQPLHEIYQQTATVTIPRKTTLLSGLVYGSKLPEPQLSLHDAAKSRADEIEKLAIAKSWVRANVITPDEAYNSPEARRTLEKFGEDLITRAIRALITERVIYHRNRGRITPGRNYDITDQFLTNMGKKRSLELTQLRRAAQFKTNVLDEIFRSGDKFVLNDDAQDGDILALINLAERDMVRIIPRDPPRDKWGLTDTGYLTRMMDKSKLRFTIDVVPVSGKYVYGPPLHETISTVPVPKNGLDSADPDAVDITTAKIPLWLDIHRNFVKVLWDSSVAVVLGAIALRPGIRDGEVAELVSPTLGGWEVELVTGWLEKVGAVKRSSGSGAAKGNEARWEVKEWWWTVVE